MAKRPAAALFLAFLGLYLLTMGGHLYSPDEEILFLTTRSLADHRSLAIEPSEPMQGFATRRGVDGREYGQYGIGQPLLAIPFYLLGGTLANWAHRTTGDRPIAFSVVQYHGEAPHEQWERLGVSLFNQFVAALLVMLLFALAADLTGDRTAAMMTAVLYGAGTIAWVHSKPFFTETLATLLVFSAFALLVRARLYRRPGWVTLAGCAAGYALLTRLDSLFAFPALGVLLVWPDPASGGPVKYRSPTRPTAGNGRRARGQTLANALGDLLRDQAAWGRIGRFCPPVVLACLVILGLNWVRFGSPLATGYEDQPEGVAFINPLLVGLYGFLFSVGKGLFFFSPPLVLFFWSIRRFVRHAPPAGWAVIVLVTTVLLVHAKWINWAGGWCWGPRHIFMVHVFLALPICVLLARPRRRIVTVAYALLLVCGIGVQLYGTSQNFIDYYFIAYRNPYIAPNATVLYNPSEDGGTIMGWYEVRMRENRFRPEREIAPWQMLAPVTDSIWRIQNSPWGMYKKMWSEGFHDYFWLERLGWRSRAHAVREMMETMDSAAGRPADSRPGNEKDSRKE
ncbi:hypothetical protein AMJ85_10090 [candidate division BRC1 bacterium SM23_51]|nr:MAG: hypothetical protein AMJ85_10090 [candidate division BRC1 bacterium SM23_51]